MPTLLDSPAPATAHPACHPLPASAGFCRVVPGFLSKAECMALIAQSEARGYADAGADYPPSYRNNERQVWDDRALAEQLLPRLRQHAPATLSAKAMAGQHQDWLLASINARFRFCRYLPGQAFNLHQDGVYHHGPSLRSHLTFMIYLTDGDAFTGGDTVFYSAGPGGDAAGRPAREIGRVRPQAGTLILFDHHIWHAGAPVTGGVKHVMRSDLLYRLGARPEIASGGSFEQAHQGYIWSLAALGQGLLASGGRDTVIRLWDEYGRAIRELHGHSQSVLGLAALPEDRLASASRDRSLRLWHWPSGRCEHVITAHDAAILGVTALPQGSLASCAADGLIKLWQPQGAAIATLAGHAGWVWQVAMLGDQQLASVSEDGTVKLWQIDSRRCIATLPGKVPLRAIAIQGRGLVTGDMDGRVTVWQQHGDDWIVERLWQAHGAAVRRLRWLAPDCLASCGEDNRVRIWQWPAGRLLAQAQHENFATDVLPLADGWLSSAYDGRLLRHPYPAPVGLSRG